MEHELLYVYVIFDSKIKKFTLFGVYPTHDAARRSLYHQIKTTRGMHYDIPQDFTLHINGTFNSDIGALQPTQGTELVGTFEEIIHAYEKGNQNAETQ